MYSVSPQTEIPKWFTYQNTSGSSVPIRLPDSLEGNYSSWRGIALFIVFKVNKVSRGQDSKKFHEFIYHLDNDGGHQDYPLIIINVPKDKLYAGSYGLRLYVSNARFRDHLDERSCISPSITISGSDVQIQKCGARLVYEEDMVEFVRNLTQETSGSPVDIRPRQELIEYPMNPSPSHVDEPEPKGQVDEPRLKGQLKELLSKLYQVSPNISSLKTIIYVSILIFSLTEHHMYIFVYFYRETLHDTTAMNIFFLILRMQLPPSGSIIKMFLLS